jgi:hypothetical protein
MFLVYFKSWTFGKTNASYDPDKTILESTLRFSVSENRTEALQFGIMIGATTRLAPNKGLDSK